MRKPNPSPDKDSTMWFSFRRQQQQEEVPPEPEPQGLDPFKPPPTGPLGDDGLVDVPLAGKPPTAPVGGADMLMAPPMRRPLPRSRAVPREASPAKPEAKSAPAKLASPLKFGGSARDFDNPFGTKLAGFAEVPPDDENEEADATNPQVSPDAPNATFDEQTPFGGGGAVDTKGDEPVKNGIFPPTAEPFVEKTNGDAQVFEPEKSPDAMFGAQPTVPGPFGVSAAPPEKSRDPSGMFGQPPTAETAPFGAAPAEPEKSRDPSGMFGQPPAAETAPFGAAPAEPANDAAAGMFGQPSPAETAPFGAAPAEPAKDAAAGMFGAQPAAPGPFGVSAAPSEKSRDGMFGQPSPVEPPAEPFGATAAAEPTKDVSGMFGQPPPAEPPAAPFRRETSPAAAMFASPPTAEFGAPPVEPKRSSPAAEMFGQPPAAEPSAVPFGTAPAEPAKSASGMFGQPATAEPSADPFGSAPVEPEKSRDAAGMFGQPPGAAPPAGMFGAPPAAETASFGAAPAEPEKSRDAAGMFGPPPTAEPPAVGMFGAPPTAEPPAAPFGASPAESPKSAVGMFGAPPTAEPPAAPFGAAPAEPAKSREASGMFAPQSTAEPSAVPFEPEKSRDAAGMFGQPPTAEPPAAPFGAAPAEQDASGMFGPPPTAAPPTFEPGKTPGMFGPPPTQPETQGGPFGTSESRRDAMFGPPPTAGAVPEKTNEFAETEKKPYGTNGEPMFPPKSSETTEDMSTRYFPRENGKPPQPEKISPPLKTNGTTELARGTDRRVTTTTSHRELSGKGVTCACEIWSHNDDERTPQGPIATGICFLDHMVDQLKSHGLLAISCVVSVDGTPCTPKMDYAGGSLTKRPRDSMIFEKVGEAVGTALRRSFQLGNEEAVFAAPLDEALVEARIGGSGAEEFFDCDLAPYGDVPRGGRLWIGRYRTSLTPTFWRGLRRGLQAAKLTLVKRRGRNAHHIVEATFKAFARALRKSIDGASPSQMMLRSPLERRYARKSRMTKETKVDVTVEVFSEPQGSSGDFKTGVPPYDELLEAMVLAAGGILDVGIHCEGDTYIDDHHTVEDVAIVLGQALDEALGSRAGCARMGNADAGDVNVVVDLSGRPHLDWHVHLPDEWIDDMASEMVEHVFHSLATHAKLTLHVDLHLDVNAARYRRRGQSPRPPHKLPSSRDIAHDVATAFGKALASAVAIDPRRHGAVPSSKGALT